jgi:hypothetical protein
MVASFHLCREHSTWFTRLLWRIKVVLATWHICSEKATIRAIERTFTLCRSTCNQVKFEDVDRCSFCS